MRLDGNCAVVTGGGRGLGRAMAMALAEAGADLVLAGRTIGDRESTAHEISKFGRKAVAVSTDVTDPSQVGRMAAAATGEFGKIDILVNNSGVAVVKPLLETSDEEWEKVLKTNLTGMFYACRSVGRHMAERKSGRIINIASVAGLAGEPNLSSYCAAKGGVIQLTRAFASEMARHGVRVNALAPGYILTGMNENQFRDEKVRDATLRRIPMKRFGLPEELGAAIVFLASEASSYMTGEVMVIDGGQNAR